MGWGARAPPRTSAGRLASANHRRGYCCRHCSRRAGGGGLEGGGCGHGLWTDGKGGGKGQCPRSGSVTRKRRAVAVHGFRNDVPSRRGWSDVPVSNFRSIFSRGTPGVL